jgi:hypothetical protein
MVDVANKAATLHNMYWQNILGGLLGWRGLGSADVPSRASAAQSIAQLSVMSHVSERVNVLEAVGRAVQSCSVQDVETLHGLTLAAAQILKTAHAPYAGWQDRLRRVDLADLWKTFSMLQASIQDFHPRLLRSELPASFGRFITALIDATLSKEPNQFETFQAENVPLEALDLVTDRLLSRHEDSISLVLPGLVRSAHRLSQAAGNLLPCLEAHNMAQKLGADSTRSALHGAGRAVALGSLAVLYEDRGLAGSKASVAVDSLCSLMGVRNVDWRIVGAQALQLVASSGVGAAGLDAGIAQTICKAIHFGLNDYTIDERGDIGSLVRLQSTACASTILSSDAFRQDNDLMQTLHGDIYRLSLEKLDRVRLQAALCRQKYLDLELPVTDIASVSSIQYFEVALRPLLTDCPGWKQQAVLEGCISCAGFSAETLLQNSRHVLATYLSGTSPELFGELMTIYAMIMKNLLNEPLNLHPALELLSYFLTTGLLHRLSGSATFKWRNLLSTVQKSHHKSNDIPKILAAVHVYRGLAEVSTIRGEVLKKLISMLKTNPYPRVRMTVAEVLFVVTREEALKGCDWSKPVKQYAAIVGGLQKLV